MTTDNMKETTDQLHDAYRGLGNNHKALIVAQQELAEKQERVDELEAAKAVLESDADRLQNQLRAFYGVPPATHESKK